MIDRPILDLALKVAESSKSKKKVGALLVYKNKVVTQAVNQDTKSHPLQARLADMVGLGEKIYLHAEIAALVKCRSEVDTIVVARLGGHYGDELRNAKPCPICSLALEQAGIQNIIWSSNDGFVFNHNK